MFSHSCEKRVYSEMPRLIVVFYSFFTEILDYGLFLNYLTSPRQSQCDVPI